MQINLENIAYHLSSSKTEPNQTMREHIMPFLKDHKVRRVLDFGCGRYLRDAAFLASKGFIVDAMDLEEQIRNIRQEKKEQVNSVSSRVNGILYDAVLLNFVIQVLPTDHQREHVLEQAYDATKEKGFLVLSLRNQSNVQSVSMRGVPFNDGFLMKKGGFYTFMRGYRRDEVQDILKNQGLSVVGFYRTYSAFIALSQKTSNCALAICPKPI